MNTVQPLQQFSLPTARSRFGWGVLGSLLLHLLLLGAISTWGAWQEAPEPEPVRASVGVTIVRPKPVVRKPVKPKPKPTKASQEAALLQKPVIEAPPPEKPKPEAPTTPSPQPESVRPTPTEPEPPAPSQTASTVAPSAAKPTPTPPRLVPTPMLRGVSETATLIATPEVQQTTASLATPATVQPKTGEAAALAPLNLSAPSTSPPPSAPVQPTLKPQPNSPIKSKHSKKMPSAKQQASAIPAAPKPVPSKRKHVTVARPEQPKVQSRKSGSKKATKQKQSTLKTPKLRPIRKTATKTPTKLRLNPRSTPLVKPKTTVLPNLKTKLSLPKVKTGEVPTTPRLSGTQLPKPKLTGIGKIATPKPSLKTVKTRISSGNLAVAKPALKTPKLTTPKLAPQQSATALAAAVPSTTEMALPSTLDPVLPTVSNTDLLAAPAAPAPVSLDTPTLENSFFEDEDLISTPLEEFPLVLEVESVVDSNQKNLLNLSGFEAIKQLQKAEREYNLHIQGKIQPKVGGASRKDRYVRIRLEIAVSGEILRFTVEETKASTSFVKKVRAAIRLAQLAPLPEALAKKPPYNVVVRFTPKN
jgi:hypothetical protein